LESRENGKIRQRILEYHGRIDKPKILDNEDEKSALEFMEEPIQVNIEKKVLERLLEHDCCGYGVSKTIETLINRLESESEPTKKTKAKSCKRK
jgi:hypothetical protein